MSLHTLARCAVSALSDHCEEGEGEDGGGGVLPSRFTQAGFFLFLWEPIKKQN